MLTLGLYLSSFMTVTVVKCQSYVENPIGDVYRYVGDSATSVCDLKNLPDSYPLLWYRDYPRIYVSRDNVHLLQ